MEKLKNVFGFAGLVFVILGIVSCNTQATTAPALTITESSSSFTSTKISFPPVSSTASNPELTSAKTVTAQSIKFDNSSGSTPPVIVNAILFTNNTEKYVTATCDVRQRDINGSFISDFKADSSYIPPNSHFINVLPSDVKGVLSISNTKYNSVSASEQSEFTKMAVRNIQIVSASVLTGELVNIGNITPKNIDIQILKQDALSIFTLAAAGFPCSTSIGAINSDGNYRCPMPPPGEKITFYLLLLKKITIIDNNNGIIDGEINILARK